MARAPTKKESEVGSKALEPYLLALGKVAHSWNHMQEQLGILFCRVAGLDDIMGMAIWHALRSDRSQRDLLQAAIDATEYFSDWTLDFPKAREDISWTLKKVNALGDGRNSAIHAPVLNFTRGVAGLRPFIFTGNPNAEKLQGKDILAEFEWYEAYFTVIMRYAIDIERALLRRRAPDEPRSWPDRPLLPTVKQKSGRQDRSRPNETK